MLCSSPTWPGICYVAHASLGIHKDPPAFAPPVLGLKCTTTNNRVLIFLFFLLFKFMSAGASGDIVSPGAGDRCL